MRNAARKIEDVELGGILRVARMAAGLTLKELAALVGSHFISLSAYERGRQRPKDAAVFERCEQALSLKPGTLTATHERNKLERVLRDAGIPAEHWPDIIAAANAAKESGR